METAKVGIIGCGNIAPQYVKGCRAFNILEVTTCADIKAEKAQTLADVYDLKALSVADLLADPAIDIVINLTVPQVHAEVSQAIIAAGKHVHSEKPLGMNRQEGRQILEAAKQAGVRAGCAPDTFLGGGLQTCRKLIDDGAIGEPVAATAFMASHGPEGWHPNPEFFYKPGGGPLFDMGPYYITALVHLLGAVKSVTGSARISFPERIATSPEKNGLRIGVEVPTHVAGVFDFAAGPVATFITSFDVWAHTLPRIEIYGSEGSLSVPDPNIFEGPVHLWEKSTGDWREVELTHSGEVRRGVGVADMAYGLKSGRTHRASGDLAFHVLDVMETLIEAAEQNKRLDLASAPERPSALPTGLPKGELDT